MNKTFDVGIRITADGRVLVTEARASKEALNQLGDSTRKVASDTATLTNQTTAQTASLASMKTGLIAAAGAYVSLGAAIGGGKAVIDAALAQERLNNTLKVATGSAEAAARETAFLRHESERLGLQFATTSQQYAKLSAAAAGTVLQGQATRDIFLGIAKAATVLGLSADQTGGALLAIEQMISKGNVSAEELRGQLGERLPGAFQIAARAMGVTTQELDKMLVKGEVTAGQLLPALAQELEKTFGGQAQEAAQGLQAKINRLDNSFADLKVAIGNTGLIDLFTGGISGATKLVNYINTAVIPAVQSIGNIPGLGTVAKALFGGPLFAILSEAGANPASMEAFPSLPAENKIIRPGSKPDLPDYVVKRFEKEANARQKAAEAAARASQKAAEERDREAQRAVEASEKTIAAFQRETQEIGLNTIQKRMLAAATEAAAAPTEELSKQILESANAWAMATQKQEDALAQQKAQQESAQARVRAEQEATRQVQQEWRSTWSNVEQNAKTAFIQFAAHGKSAMQSIGEAIKFSIIDVLYQLTIRKWILNIGASFEGSHVNGVASSASGGKANSLNLLSSSGITSGLRSSMSGIVSGAGRLLGSSGLSAFGAGLSGVGTAGASAGIFSAAGGAGTAFIGGAGTAIGGTGMGMAASMGAGIGSALAAVAGPAMIALVATQLFKGLAGDKRLGGGFGKFINKIGDIPILGDMIPIIPLLNGLFGRGPLKQRETSLTADIGLDGFTSGALQTNFRAKGGLFRSDKNDFVRVDAMSGAISTDNNHLQGFAEGLSKAAKDIFGAFEDAAKQSSAALKQTASDLGLSTDALQGFNYQIKLTSEKGKGLTDEQIGAEIERMTDAMARKLLPQVDEFSKRGETALQTVTRLGTELNTLVDAASLVLGKSVADAKAFVSGSSFAGRTGFVDVAGGADLLTQKAQFFAQNFLTAAEQLAPAQERLSDELKRLGLSTDLTRDQFKNLVQSFGKVNGISEETLQSMLNLAPAFIQVRDAAKQQAIALTTGAYSELQKSVDAERKRINSDYNDNLNDINTQIQSVTDSVGKLKSLSDALKSTINTIRPLSRDQAKQQIAAAITDARAGRFADAADLQQALGVLGNQSTSGFSNSFEFAREQAKTANLLGELGGLTDAKLSTEERSLKALEDQRTALQAGFEQETERLDAMLEQGQQQIDTLNGLNTAILSLSEAIGLMNLRAVQAGGAATIVDPATGTPRISGNPRITDREINDFVRQPGITDMDIYHTARDNNVSFAQYAAATGSNLADLQQWAISRDLPTFADGGFHLGGLRIVGERGPELEFTGPSRIVSNNDMSRLLNNDNVVNELRALISEMQQIKEFSRRTSQRLDAVTKGGTALRTKAA